MKKTAAILILLCAVLGSAQTTNDALRQGFENPPETARPRVWWHWLDGNITKEGIKLDLEWMHRTGLGGFQAFDASLGPTVVKNRLVYMSPEWKDAFKYATVLADRLGFEEAIASSPGFSETGGPWVLPNEAMKKYVWSEIRLKGGPRFKGVLPHPPSNTGAFQNLPIEDVGAAMGGVFHAPEFYADSAVIAFRVAKNDVTLESLQPVITSSRPIDTALLSDGDLTKATNLEMPDNPGEKAWIQYSFPQAQTIRAITIVAGKRSAFEGYLSAGRPSGIALESSDDGTNYRIVVSIPKGGSTEHTLSFAPVTARYFRVTFGAPPAPEPGSAEARFGGSSRRPSSIPIAELVLHPGARVNEFEEKAAFDPVADLYGLATPEFSHEDVVEKRNVIDLTGKMESDGTLDWIPPPGDWVVMRFGYSLLGITNHPASKEATGLEVDKLNSKYVRNYMNRYLDMFKDTVGAEMMGKRGIRYMVNDSWEAGAQNWTDDMIQQFTRRRGYDPRPWLPVLAGRVVESSEASDRFLWDFRKTIADLTTDAHYGQIAASLKERGMGHYGESHENSRAFIGDGMEAKKLDDIPMSAMWAQMPGVGGTPYDYNADDRESASVAHIYGKNLAAAETFTTCDSTNAYAWSPATLKPSADLEFLNGINRLVIHVSAHQPFVDKAPGLSFGPCGQWFTRNETWAEQANVWIDYLARSSWLLQQGKFAADVLYFYGEDSNVSSIFCASAPEIPFGYDFDYVNADALTHELFISHGRIMTRGGMSYRVLALGKYSSHMSLPVLRALHKLVEDGATVVGDKPVGTPSLADDASLFNRLNDDLFGTGTGVHAVGRGRVYAGQEVQSALRALKIDPDFAYSGPHESSQILFTHRKLTDGDLYFLENRSAREASVNGVFRVAGKAPEFWYAETGDTSPAAFTIANGRTTVPVHLEPWGSVFVVFRKPTKATGRTLSKTVETQLAQVEGPWTVSFQQGRGAPGSITLDKLISWTEDSDKGVKYFSGAGTYSKTIQVPANWFKNGATLWLDLGDVRNLAVVAVNGKELATVWHAPYRVNLTGALKPSANELTIKVINTWVNRIIGDQQSDATIKYTFTTWKAYRADSTLLPSGLLGPVSITRTE